jgi:hypothetical protein
MAREIINKNLGKGIVNIPSDPELIPQNASQDSLNFISIDGQIELTRGKLLIGGEETANGFVKGDGWGYRADGTAIHFRKINTKIQYYNESTSLWVDVVTGLTSSAEYTFARYTSPAGTFVYATGADGIYKIHTANPSSYCSMYDSLINWKGKSIISGTGEAARMIMWDMPNDKTALYLSYIDKADSSVYTTVTAEAVAASGSGTLAFKAGDAKRSCFGLVFTIGAETFTDDKNGKLIGSAGGTGTINYITGAWTLSNTAGGTVTYLWENTNNKGITDFRESATRLVGEGIKLRQDEGGDPIQKVEVFEGVYFIFKKRSVYSLTIATTDDSFLNVIFRRDIGLEYWRSSVTIGKGIVFMNLANKDNPQLTILNKNVYGDYIEPSILAQHFDFSGYEWDMCAMGTFGEYIIFSGRTKDSNINNRLFFYNVRRDTIDILNYGTKTITTNEGRLYIGDVLTDNIYEILSGFDDDNENIEAYWISNDERYGTEILKKVKSYRFKGLITPNQYFEVWADYDGDGFGLVGTVRGDSSYVDKLENYTIGTQGIGSSLIGGEGDFLDGGFFMVELKAKSPKFRKRRLKIIPKGIGYLAINMIEDFGIRTFNQKLPSKYRTKQNVSLDGTQTNI